MLNFSRKSIIGVIIVLALVLSVLAIHAQAGATPITIGQNMTGQITDANTPVLYAISVNTPESLQIQVLAITPGFAPAFRLIDPDGIAVFDATNPGTQTIVAASPTLGNPGAYIVAVSSANQTTGQFMINIQVGAPVTAPLPTPLTVGQAVSGTVDIQTTRQDYDFTASMTDVLILHVTSATSASGPVVALRKADSAELFGLSNTQVSGVDYRIPMGNVNYRVEVTLGGADSEAYTVCLTTENGSVTCPGSGTQPGASATPTPAIVQIDPNGPCEVASTGNAIDNIRSGPGTNFDVVAQLPPNSTALVISRTPDNSWFEINYNGTLGWISGAVVIIGGNCAGIPVILQPTLAPTETLPSIPTLLPVPSDTATNDFPRINITGTRIHLQHDTPTPTPRFQVQPSLVFGPTPTLHLHHN